MLKRDITFEDFDGETVTETHYFNLMKSELVEVEAGHKEGLEEFIKRIVKTNDKEGLIGEFKKLILQAYGVKSDDGRRFIKSDELREAFSQTLAYDTLFMELALNDDAAATFIKGVLPKDLQQEISAEEAKTKSGLQRPNIQPAENLRNPPPPPPAAIEGVTNA